MKDDNVTVKTGQTKKLILALIAVFVVCAAILGVLWGLKNGYLGGNKVSNGTQNELQEVAASDEETLRKLLLEEATLLINVDKDIEVDEQFIVKGTKTLTGDGELKMLLSAEWGQSLLVVTEGASLTMDGLVLNGNYVADGIHMEQNAALTYLSGTIKCTDVYSIQAQGDVTIKGVDIEKAEYIGIFAEKGSLVNIEGGNLTESATHDLYVQLGAVAKISGDVLFDGCMGDSVINYGMLDVQDGKFANANSYTFNNYGELTIAGKGNDFVECTGSRLGVVCTRKDAETTISGIYVYDTNRQGVVTVGGKTTIKDSKFERTGYHAVEIQKGDATVENVTVIDSKNAGLEAYTDANVEIKNFKVDGCEGIGIASRGGKITGSDIEIADTGKYGISCGNSKNGKGAVSVSKVVISNPEKSGFYVYNKGNMELDSVDVSGSKSRGIYIEDTASLTLSGQSKIHKNEYRGIEARGKFVMNDGQVFDNKTDKSGAGVYISEKGNFTMNGGAVYNNTSGLRGGGVCVTEGKVTINNGEVYNNTATNNGGGLYAQKKAVVTLKAGSIKNNKSEMYGDGVFVTSEGTKIKMTEQFYLGGNDVKLDNVKCVLEITGNKLAKHSASDPLLLTPNYSAKEGTVVATCKNTSIAKAMAVMVKAGDGSYNVLQKDRNFTIQYATADMDMTGADTVYVSNFKELKDAVKNTKSKRYIVLKADIVMEERLRFPGGATICIKDDGNKRTITRAAGFADNMFVTHYGTGFYLEATKAGNLVVDGAHSSDVDGKKVQPLVRVAGSTVLRNVTLQNNGSLDKGTTVRGALLRQLYGDFEIYNSVLTGGRCDSGGAVMIDKGIGYIEGSTISNNQSVIGGGAVRAAANTKLDVVDSIFDGNRAGTAGGAIVAVSAANVTVTDTKFVNNVASNFGGALSAQGEGTKLVLKGTDSAKAIFENNSAKTIGAVCAMEKAELSVNGYTFENNTATNGRAGAIAVNSNASATLKNSAFYNNVASGSGGALSADNSTVEVLSCEFGKENAGNIAGDKGGAILVTGNATVSMSLAKDGLYNSLGYNEAVVGGAIAAYGGKEVVIQGYELVGNQSKDGGGALYIYKDSVATTKNAKFIENVSIKETEKGTEYSNGGAVQCLGTYYDTNSSYTENIGKNGGAVIVMTDGKAVMNSDSNDAKFMSNVANGNGGALFVNIGGSVEMTGYQFESNKGNQGAAVYVQKDAKLAELTDVVMTGNQATNGGAIYCNGTLTVSESEFKLNQSKSEGGAIYANEGSIVTVTECDFEENKTTDASKAGGALYIAGDDAKTENVTKAAEVTGSDNTFTGNVSTGNGGAIYCKGSYTDTNSAYTNNTGAKGGALIVMSGGTAELTGTDAKFSGNQATASQGTALFVQGTLNIKGYVFEENPVQTVYVTGTLNFDDITGATLEQGSANAKLNVVGYENGNKLTITPKEHKEGNVVLIKADGVADDVFKAACKNITVTTDSKGNAWSVDEEGELQMEKAVRIGTTYYSSFTTALADANANGGTGDAADIVLYLQRDTQISSTVTINKNIAIRNEVGVNVTITRSKDMDMFTVNSNAKLTLGTNDANETGKLVVDGALTNTSAKRIVDNKDKATFVLGKNATLQNAKSTQWGAALINRGTGVAQLYGSIKNNECTGAGGAILQHGTGTTTIYEGSYTNNIGTRPQTHKDGPSLGGFLRAEAGTVEIKGGTFSGNNATGLGGLLWSKAGATVVLSGGTFENNTAAQGGAIYSNGILKIAGPITDAHKLTVTPNEYTEGKVVLTKADEITDEVFKAACVGIQVTPDANGTTWSIDENGALKVYAARIGVTYYATWADAIAAANAYTGTDEVVLYVRNDVTLTSAVTISKKVVIRNESGANVTIGRSENITMFTTASGAQLTFGTNDEGETGKIVVDGATPSGITQDKRMVNNVSGATFILGKNATLQNANNNQWGCAMINKGTATLYGTVRNNTCTGDGGAILQHDGALTIVDGSYTGNQASNASKNAWGGVVRVHAGSLTIQGGTFSGNTAAKLGGVVYSAANTTVTISGGTFTGNTANTDGNAVYVIGTATITGGTFATEEPAQEIFVEGTLNYKNVPEALIKGTGTKNEIN